MNVIFTYCYHITNRNSMHLLKIWPNVFFFQRFDRRSFAPALELRGKMSRPAMYSNVLNTHRLGIVEIYEKINEGGSGVGRCREKQRGPSLLSKYYYFTTNADRQFVKKNINEVHTKSKLTLNSSSGSSPEFPFGIITGLATIVECGIFNLAPKIS